MGTINITNDIVILLLYIPIIVTITNVVRYIIGIKTLALYPTIVLTFAYFFTGFKYGMLFTAIVVIVALLAHSVLKRIRMHYVSRTAINYTIVAISTLLILYLLFRIPFTAQYFDPLGISLEGLILIITLADFVIKTSINKDFSTTIKLITSTILIGLLGLISFSFIGFTNFIVQNAWIIPLLIIANLLIGRTTSLKLADFLRFRSLIKEQPEVDEKKK